MQQPSSSSASGLATFLVTRFVELGPLLRIMKRSVCLRRLGSLSFFVYFLPFFLRSSPRRRSPSFLIIDFSPPLSLSIVAPARLDVPDPLSTSSQYTLPLCPVMRLPLWRRGPSILDRPHRSFPSPERVPSTLFSFATYFRCAPLVCFATKLRPCFVAAGEDGSF